MYLAIGGYHIGVKPKVLMLSHKASQPFALPLCGDQAKPERLSGTGGTGIRIYQVPQYFT